MYNMYNFIPPADPFIQPVHKRVRRALGRLPQKIRETCKGLAKVREGSRRFERAAHLEEPLAELVVGGGGAGRGAVDVLDGGAEGVEVRQVERLVQVQPRRREEPQPVQVHQG
jgi:hypothetical protein